jgi:dihydropyrimidinase
VETTLPLLYTYGVDRGLISLQRLAQVLSTNPARLFGLYPRKGALWVGADADVVVYDPRGEYLLRDEELHSAPGVYTPFAGLTVKGRVKLTLSRGAVIYKDGQFLGKPDHGRFVPCRPFNPEVVFAL